LSDRGEPSASRALPVDLLKALGILAVVFIHAVRSPWDPGAVALEGWLGRLAHFAVPGFLAASGYLYAAPRSPEAGVTRRRLLRIALPYAVASLAAQVYWAASGAPHAPTEILQELLLGSSFGPYYYVFQIFTLVLLTPLIARLPRAWLIPITLLLIVAQLFVNSLGLPLFWALRIPLFSGGSFMLGWTIRRYEAPLQGWLGSRRSLVTTLLAGIAALCATGMGAGLPELADRACEWIYVNVFMLLIFARALGHSTRSTALCALSDSTWAIFLFHLFFVYALAAWRPLEPGVFDAFGFALLWSGGLLGAGSFAWLASRLLGRHARVWLGA
jgi:surface polysaccharide O-acyltransferase-like enzyme